VEEKALQEDFLASQFNPTSRTPEADRTLGGFFDLLDNGFRLPHYYEFAALHATLRKNYELCVEALAGYSKNRGRKPQAGFSVESARDLLQRHGCNAAPGDQLSSRLSNLQAALERHDQEKLSMDVRVMASAASAVVSTRNLPPKLNPLIQNLMRGVKVSSLPVTRLLSLLDVCASLQSETNTLVQARFGNAIAKLIALCVNPDHPAPAAVANKIVGNLASLLCQDSTFIPQVSTSIPEGIVTLRQKKAAKGTKKGLSNIAEDSAINKDAITRRGAQSALIAIIHTFGEEVFAKVPRLWDLMTATLTQYFPAGASKNDIEVIM
jgi:hypothetical protein